MNEQFNITLYLNDGDGKAETFKGTAEFAKKKDDYGNGYHMFIKMATEPWGGQSYDIRYDTDFHSNRMIEYLTGFFSNRFTGENGSWKMVGIRVHEAEF